MHVRVLQDLDVDLLIRGLAEAALTTKNWLTPGEIWELCMGGSRADLAAQAAEEAWLWMLKYNVHEANFGGNCPTYDAAGVEVVRVPPPIPPEIERVLVLLGGTVYKGRRRMDLEPTDKIHFLKKDFTTAYTRSCRLL
jgi:hypothetical protein